MTCVIALKTKNGILMGADSALSMSTHLVSVPDKILISNGIIIGFAGSRIQTKFQELIKIDSKMDYDDHYTESVHQIFCQNFDKSMIIFSGGKHITFMSPNTWFRCSEDYYAIGDGYAYALGAMEALKNIKNPYKRLKKALMASEKYCSSVKAPFIFEKL